MGAGSFLIGVVFTNQGRFNYKSGQSNRGRFITNWCSYYKSEVLLQVVAQQQGAFRGCIFKA